MARYIASFFYQMQNFITLSAKVLRFPQNLCRSSSIHSPFCAVFYQNSVLHVHSNARHFIPFYGLLQPVMSVHLLLKSSAVRASVLQQSMVITVSDCGVVSFPVLATTPGRPHFALWVVVLLYRFYRNSVLIQYSILL